MMTIREVVKIVSGEVLVGEDRLDERVDTATSEMLDITCIVFSRGKKPSEEILDMAEEVGITVISSPLTTYTACGELYTHGLPGTKPKQKPAEEV